MRTFNNQRPVFLTARWHHLAMLNYEIDPAMLEPYVPYGMVLDAFDGRTYVSLVGFVFVDTRLRGVPIPWHRNFEEVNLRFYVRRRHATGDRRGVVFIREIAPRRMVAAVARYVYNEQYVALGMRHRVELNGAGISPGGEVEYAWRAPRGWDHICVRVGAAKYAPQLGSLEAFITEHYWAYSTQRDGGTLEYHVEHPPWNVWPAVQCDVNIDVERWYGNGFVEALGGGPASAFVCDGSAVAVRSGRRI